VLGVDDEIVIVVLVAQAAQAFPGGLFCIFFGELAACCELLVMIENPHADLDQILGFLLAVFKHAVLELQQRAEAEHQ